MESIRVPLGGNPGDGIVESGAEATEVGTIIIRWNHYMSIKSPSGSLTPYYYMGGELHPLKYGSYFHDKKRLLEIIKKEEEFILGSSGHNNRRIWMDLYETALDAETIGTLALHVKAIQSKIKKLCFVGCSPADRRKLLKRMKSESMDIVHQVEFFSDPEDAKQWLIGESSIDPRNFR